MKNSNRGIHHISIISGQAQKNAEFYVGILGLRMVLKSVNQDDPSNYHLFYANGDGEPGSSITFFPLPRAVKAKYGTGETVAISFSVPVKSIPFWQKHLRTNRVVTEPPVSRFGQNILKFTDPDGLPLEIIEDARSVSASGWQTPEIPVEHAIRGFRYATIRLTETKKTQQILEEILGFQLAGTEGSSILMETNSTIGRGVILEKASKTEPGRTGRGTVHHVAFRVKDETELIFMRNQVMSFGLHPTDIIDRHVFKSIYLNTPGGVLFEIATDGPGYKQISISEDEMGKNLFLPPWLEHRREQIKETLPPVDVS